MSEKKLGRRHFIKAAAISATVVSAATQLTLAAENRSVNNQIPHKELGNTGAKIPILQLGTSQRLDPTYDKVMHRCFKGGVTYIDTALSYGWGSSHRAIANFLKQIKTRDKIWLTSKSGSRSTRGLLQDIDECLSELGTDYLNMYFMHGVRDEDMLDSKYLKVGDQLRKSGKTRFFGFSCHDGNVVELMNKAARVGGIDAILFRYNFRRYGDRDLNLAIDACKKAGIGLIAMKTMGSVPNHIEKVAKFKSDNFSLAQAKLKSVWADDRIDSLVSEMDSVRIVRENIAAAKTETDLSANEVHQLNQLAALTSHYACNGCSHFCESAIEGNVAIADSLRFLMYHESYGKTSRAKELFKAIPQDQRHFEGVDFAKAASVCPQGIDIKSRLMLVQSTLA